MFDSIEEAVQEIRVGRMVVVVDDEDRENEGDAVMAAEHATPENINFMARECRGLICTPMTAERAGELELPQMVRDNTDTMRTAFTVSVDAAGTSTGISAYDRAETVRALVDTETTPDDLRRPGHIFPLVAKDGGVLRRAGHTEAGVDLAQLAGLAPVAVICEIMKDDGTMARVDDLVEFCSEFDLKLVTIEDLIRYRRTEEELVEHVAQVQLPTRFGRFTLHAYRDRLTGEVHQALVKGDLSGVEAPMVRVHSECLTGDVFGSLRCDCGPQLSAAMARIQEEGTGVILYMRQEGRGIGLINKLRAYDLQDGGLDTVEANEALGFPADLRDYGIGAQILKDLGIRRLRLLTNNEKKTVGLRGYGLQVIERLPLETGANPHNIHYLQTKRDKLGHRLSAERGRSDESE